MRKFTDKKFAYSKDSAKGFFFCHVYVIFSAGTQERTSPSVMKSLNTLLHFIVCNKYTSFGFQCRQKCLFSLALSSELPSSISYFSLSSRVCLHRKIFIPMSSSVFLMCFYATAPLAGLAYPAQRLQWLRVGERVCRCDTALGGRRKLCVTRARRGAQSINKQEALQTRGGSSLTSTPSVLSNFTGFTCRVLQTHSGR